MMATGDGRDEDRPASLRTAALSALLPFLVFFAFCLLAGLAAAIVDDGEANWTNVAIVGAAALLMGGLGLWGLKRLKPWTVWREPVAPRIHKANNLIALAIVAGVVAMTPLAVGAIGQADPFALFSNSPMPLAVVLPAIAGWLLAMVLSLLWHRSVDEHEARTYEFGGLAGLYLYCFLAPTWWLAWRGGLVPAPDTMVTFAIVMAAWGIGWFWRRYR